ncbi:MAG: murein biosynthesis integral membrane protein MurJ [Patescibacteria group bacterium]|jgi:putative peptidoglycan lipid II flippase
MLKRLFSPDSKSVTGAAILISTATLLSRLIGIIRDRTFAHFFGAGSVMDAYYAAFKIPDLIYSLLIAGALTAGFIPTFTRLFYESEDKSKAWKLTNNIISIVGVALLILGGLGIIFSPFLVKIVAPGFPPEQLKLVNTFTRIMLISPFLLGISMVIGGVLQSLRQFLLYSIAPIFYNFGIIIGIVFFTKFLGIAGLAWGVAFGSLLHLSVQIYGVIKNGYRWHWHFNLKDPDTRLIGKLMLPRTFGLAVNQINTVVITVIASFLPLGSVAIFNYANNLQDVPTGIIGIPFALAVFPILSRLTSPENRGEFGALISSTVRQILFLVIPLSVCFLLLRAQITRVVLGTGAFDWNATIQTADTLAFFTLSLFAQSLIPLFARAFYSLNNTMTPFLISIISELICIIGALLFMKPLGVAGLALAKSISALINMSALAILLRKEVREIIDDKLLPLILKTSVAALVMGIIIQYLKYPLAQIFDQHYFWGILMQGLIAALVGILAYGFICTVLRVDEMIHLKNSFKKRWLRLWNIGEGIDQAEKL